MNLSISEEKYGFRIWVRRHVENRVQHIAGRKLYSTFKEACQEVFRVTQDARIIDTVGHKIVTASTVDALPPC